MRETLKLIVTLGLVTAISGGVLGLFYNYTMPIVQARQMADLIDLGFKEVLPEAQGFVEIEDGESEKPADVKGIYEGVDQQGQLVGIAFEAQGQGFGGAITMAVGVNPETETVVGIKILSHAETPGMGAKIEEPEFYGQFQDKSLSDPFVVGKDVDGITGATVSSKAVAATVAAKTREVLNYLGYSVAAPVVKEPVEAEPEEQEPVRQEAEVIDMDEVRKELLPEAQEFISLEGEMPADVTAVYEGVDGEGQRIGLVFETAGQGFEGPIAMAVGVDLRSEEVTGIKILSHGETQGLGARIEEPEFLSQFQGKSVSDSFVVGEDVDGITGATISSTAVTDTVGAKVRQVLDYISQ